VLFRSPIEAQEETLLRDLTGLALAVAGAVLRREIADGGAVEQVLAEALAELGEVEGVLEVELNPADASLVREFLDEQAEHGQWRLRENPGLSRGGVRLHTPTTYIDASVERTLEVLLGRLHREAENALSPESS
jgi:flagellar assembly protein FliH